MIAGQHVVIRRAMVRIGLAEGSELPDAARFNRAVADLMTRNING